LRFVVTGEWTRNHLLRVIVWCFLVYTLVFWLTSFALYFSKMSLDPHSVVAYYLGDEERYLQPRTFGGMLEILHFHAFSMGILLMTLTHLLLFVPLDSRVKAIGIAFAFGASLGGELAGWGVRFVSPGFAYLKVACFLVSQSVILLLMVAVAGSLLATSANGDGRSAED
jgi:hypothetical protein